MRWPVLNTPVFLYLLIHQVREQRRHALLINPEKLK